MNPSPVMASDVKNVIPFRMIEQHHKKQRSIAAFLKIIMP
jgi:hypothetical protein